ncbi:MAG TPA: phosphatase PAP2 family protein [Burkholderiales bacterium]|nr:phosphatase PAP2 family protein [Burkholderiales bacterium]
MKRWLVPAVAAALFLAIAALGANAPIFLALNKLGPATSDWLWANITVLGDTLVAFTLCLPLWRRRPDLLWAFLFLALLGTLWVHGLKHAIDIARPPGVMQDLHVIGPAFRTGSFPSGHTTTAFGVAGLMAMGLQFRTRYVIFLSAAILVGVSRSVVGVHWPLDILAGAFGGWLAAVAALWLAQKTIDFGNRPWVQWALGIFLAACAAFLVFGPNKSGYAQAELFQRAVGICCLAATALRLRRASG